MPSQQYYENRKVLLSDLDEKRDARRKSCTNNAALVSKKEYLYYVAVTALILMAGDCLLRHAYLSAQKIKQASRDAESDISSKADIHAEPASAVNQRTFVQRDVPTKQNSGGGISQRNFGYQEYYQKKQATDKNQPSNCGIRRAGFHHFPCSPNTDNSNTPPIGPTGPGPKRGRR